MEIFAFILVIFFFYILFPWIIKASMRNKFLSVIRNSGCICLTFDDGPCPESTPKILGLLEKAGIKATFFLVGENVEKYPSLAERIIANGHEVGEHSYSHSHPWKSWPFVSLRDLVKGGKIIKKYRLSLNNPIFRPPYGKLNLITLLYIWLTKKRIAFWDIDPKDFRKSSGKKVAESIMKHLEPGSVILLHDGRRNLNMDPFVTVSALKEVLSKRSNGRCFATISDAISRASKNEGIVDCTPNSNSIN